MLLSLIVHLKAKSSHFAMSMNYCWDEVQMCAPTVLAERYLKPVDLGDKYEEKEDFAF